MLEIRNLVVKIADEDKQIINGLNLTVADGEVAAIMGPNGSGKSTLSYVIAGKEDYEVLDGEILLNGENVLEMEADARAAAGIFLAFQYPLEIPGVATMTFLKAAMNAQRKARGEAELLTPDFIKQVNAAADSLSIDKAMLRRPLNVGFSGGEKKRMEILQMALLAPSMCILDETDSGLDIDALRIVAEGVNAPARQEPRLPGDHPLSAPARPYRARHRARHVEGPDREERRQGAGARTREERLCRLCGGCLMAIVTPLKTAAEQALVAAVRQGQGGTAGRRRRAQAARGCLRRVRGQGPAASPARILALYRSALAAARGQAAGHGSDRHAGRAGAARRAEARRRPARAGRWRLRSRALDA
jgi:Fe-S cluster assembly ATP-binding protein